MKYYIYFLLFFIFNVGCSQTDGPPLPSKVIETNQSLIEGGIYINGKVYSEGKLVEILPNNQYVRRIWSGNFYVSEFGYYRTFEIEDTGRYYIEFFATKYEPSDCVTTLFEDGAFNFTIEQTGNLLLEGFRLRVVDYWSPLNMEQSCL